MKPGQWFVVIVMIAAVACALANPSTSTPSTSSTAPATSPAATNDEEMQVYCTEHPAVGVESGVCRLNGRGEIVPVPVNQ